MSQSENTVLKVLHEHDMHAFHLTGTEREGTFVPGHNMNPFPWFHQGIIAGLALREMEM